MNTHLSRRKNGYVSLLTTLSLVIIIFAFAVTGFRETRQAHQVQAVTQIRMDYDQKERAFLRALLHLAPNAAMRAMQQDSSDIRATLSWNTVFADAFQMSNLRSSARGSTRVSLGIPTSAISANSSDNTLYTMPDIVTSPAGDGRRVLPSTQPSDFPTGFNFPPALNWNGSSSFLDRNFPIISLNKKLPGETDDYTEMPYPDIAFGYQEQGQDFLAKRHWWAFNVDFGADATSGFGESRTARTYVLSIYEVPSQVAISSSSFTTNFGQFAGGQNWADTGNISVQGRSYARRAIMQNNPTMGSVSAREAVTRNGGTNPLTGTLSERRNAEALNSLTSFAAFSTVAESSLVSFTPVNRGLDFFDMFSSHDDSNNVSPTGWNEYSTAAQNCTVVFNVLELDDENGVDESGNPIERLDVGATFGSTYRAQRCTRGASWREPGQAKSSAGIWDDNVDGDDWPVQDNTETPQISLPDGRRFLALDLEKLANFIDEIGASDTTVNNKVYVGSRYDGPNDTYQQPSPTSYANENISKPRFPSTDDDYALVIIGSRDLSSFPEGLSIVTPFRVYFADDFNTVAVTPPSGSGLPTPWYPPVSIFAPEKRFGVANTVGNIKIDGQLGYLSDDISNATVNPLDLKDGATNTVSSDNIEVNLESINQRENLPPLNSMSWMTTIEEL